MQPRLSHSSRKSLEISKSMRHAWRVAKRGHKSLVINKSIRSALRIVAR